MSDYICCICNLLSIRPNSRFRFLKKHGYNAWKIQCKLPDNLKLSNKTYELDTKTTVSAVKDLTKGLFGKDNLMKKAYEIQGASEIDVDFEHELKNLTKNGSLLKQESKEVEKILMRNDPEDGVQGGSTLWKLTQAITAHARELTPERSRELHEISGALLNRVKLQA